jgi:ABC-2 type transport system ATP-binding protein
VSFDLPTGEVFGLIGPNGAGKSTLIKIMLGLILPDAGLVEFYNADGVASACPPTGYLPEERGLYQDVKARDVILYFATLQCGSRELARRNLPHWADRLGIASELDKKVSALSKGTQQKVQLAAVLVAEPQLIILDEPLSGLDPANARLLKDLLMELAVAGCTVLVVTHQMDLVEDICSRVVMLNHGKIVLNDSTDRILTRSSSVETFTIRTDADLDNCPIIDHYRRSSNMYNVTLKPEMTIDNYFAWSLNRGYTVAEFEKTVRSLESIFLEEVTNDHHHSNPDL